MEFPVGYGKKTAPPTTYATGVPLDSDIQHSIGHMETLEKAKGEWKLPELASMAQKSNPDQSPDPQCTSVGCTWKKGDFEHEKSFFDHAQVSSDPTWSSAGSPADWREGHNGLMQVSSDPICTSAGCPESKSLKKDSWPKDYPVVNLGVDRHIMDTHSSLEWAEKNLNQKLEFPVGYGKKAEKPTMYATGVPLDSDIQHSIGHMETLEKAKGVWKLPELAAMQVSSDPTWSSAGSPADWREGHNGLVQSDPICTSAGCPESKSLKKDSWPKDYPVPNLGQDRHILDTHASIEWAEKNLNQKLQFPTGYPQKKVEKPTMYATGVPLDSDIQHSIGHMETLEKAKGVWKLPELAAVQLSSDPICSSSGCPKTKLKEKDPYPMNYPVPNFGVDRDIMDTYNSVNLAEKQLDHEWNFTFAKDYKNPAAKTMYNFDPNLDPDMVHTANHMATAEKTLGKWDAFD